MRAEFTSSLPGWPRAECLPVWPRAECDRRLESECAARCVGGAESRRRSDENDGFRVTGALRALGHGSASPRFDGGELGSDSEGTRFDGGELASDSEGSTAGMPMDGCDGALVGRSWWWMCLISDGTSPTTTTTTTTSPTSLSIG